MMKLRCLACSFVGLFGFVLAAVAIAPHTPGCEPTTAGDHVTTAIVGTMLVASALILAFGDRP